MDTSRLEDSHGGATGNVLLTGAVSKRSKSGAVSKRSNSGAVSKRSKSGAAHKRVFELVDVSTYSDSFIPVTFTRDAIFPIS